MHDAIIEELSKLYTQEHRKYHSLSHILTMLEIGKPMGLTKLQYWAVWFHDSIYEIGAKDNEVRSANLAVEYLNKYKVGLLDYEIEIIQRIILDTTNHQPTIEESKLVIDLDISMFAEDWEVYLNLVTLIRNEYPDTSEEQWNKGRSKFLIEFAKRDPFYSTSHFKQFTERALNNIENELSRMGR